MRSSASRLVALAMLGSAAIALSACSDLFGDADDAGASAGSPFTQALAVGYADLGNQADDLPAAETGFFDSLNPFSASDDPKDMLTRAFNAKSGLAKAGEEPAPEAAPSPDISAIHDRLVAAVAAGKAQFPDQAARAQTSYDCWVLFSMTPVAAANAAACKQQLDVALPALETAVRPAPPPMPAPAPVTAAPPPAPVTTAPAPAPVPSDFTVYFEFNSWTLTAEDLTVLTNVINAARAGGQTHITIVGHTDTSGSADYNQKLSVHRANVVVEALVDMGARRAAIKASGVGENDLAVQTEDGVKEAKNRRAVVTLTP